MRMLANAGTKQFVTTARGVNKVILLGNVGADAKTKTYNEGKSSVTFFPLATNEVYIDKTGERVDRAQWHNIVIYNENLAQRAQKLVKKGALIYVEGTLSTRTYKDSKGMDKTICEVILPKFRGDLSVLSVKRGIGDEHGDGEDIKPEAESTSEITPEMEKPTSG